MSALTEEQRDAEMAAWAKAGDFHPRTHLTGAEARAETEALLTAAGVDLAALERRVGRPRVDPSDETVSITFRAPRTVDVAVRNLAKREGRDRSDLLRDALSEYILAHA